MTAILAYAIALAAALPTTLCVLALWVIHARVVKGYRPDTVLVPLLFLFVPLTFAVSAVSNVIAVLIGQFAGLAAPNLQGWATVGSAGVLVWSGCAWSQRGSAGLFGGVAPVSATPVVLFSVADMLILAGGLHLIPLPSVS